jgi:O-antigen ligase
MSLIAAGAALSALVLGVGAVALVEFGRPALALCGVVSLLAIVALLRPGWLLPGLLGLAWVSIPVALLGGLPSPVEAGALVALALTAHRIAAGATDLRGPLLFCTLIALAAVASGLLARRGSVVPSDLLEPLAFVVIVAALAPGADAVRRVVIALVTAGLFLGVGAALSVLAGPTELFPVTEAESLQEVAPRAAGPFGEPNFFALSLAALVPPALYLARTPGPLRLLGLAAAAALAAGILATGSRGGLVAAAVGGIAFALSVRPSRSAVLVSAVVAAALAVPFVGQAASSGERGVGARLGENRIALAMWADRPIAGVGPGGYAAEYRDYSRDLGDDPRYLREAHSLPLEILAEQGLAGALAWAAGVLLLVRWIQVRRVLATALGKAIVSGLAAFAVGSLFLHGSQLRLLYILVGLVFALGSTARRPVGREAT